MSLPRYLLEQFGTPEEFDGLIPLEGPAVRRGIPRYPGMELGAPSQDELLDAELGIDQPELDQFQEEEFDVDPLDSFLERLSANGVPQGLQKPQGFWQGVAGGVAQGAVGRGQRVTERRKKFEGAQVKRAAERDKANLEATQKYRDQRATGTRELAKETRAERRTQEAYNRDNPPLSAALLEVAPWLGRSFQPGENVPKDVYQGILKSMTPEAIAEVKRKEAGELRDQKRIGMDERRLGISEQQLEIQQAELGLKRAEAAKPGSGKPPTVAQERAQLFYSRAKESTVNAIKGGLESRMLKKAWSLAQPPQMQSDPDTRKYWRAMESFSLALNRLESGASIAPTEFSKVRNLYFVIPGDTDADVEDKKKMRETIIESLWRMQSPAMQEQTADNGGASITPAQLWEN